MYFKSLKTIAILYGATVGPDRERRELFALCKPKILLCSNFTSATVKPNGWKYSLYADEVNVVLALYDLTYLVRKYIFLDPGFICDYL